MSYPTQSLLQRETPLHATMDSLSPEKLRILQLIRLQRRQQTLSSIVQTPQFPNFNMSSSATKEAATAQLLRMLIMQGHDSTMQRQYQDLLMHRDILQRNATADVSVSLQTDEKITAISRRPDISNQEPPTKKTKLEVKEPKEEDKAQKKDKATQKPKKKDTKWLGNFEKLKEYKEKNGDTIVPRGYALDSRLASWVAEQRKQYKLLQDNRPSSITPDRIALLDELEFAWNAQEAAWTRHMDDLRQFRSLMAHCHVPLNHEDFPKLGLWVKEQRRHYTLMKQGKSSHMTDERAAELDKVGFCWDTHEATWLERFKELTLFKKNNGNCLVPTNYSDNPKLGTWVHHQRRQFKKHLEGKACHITEERIRSLDSIGFVWYPRDRSAASITDDSSSSDDDTQGADIS
jgi:hypothetical protein